MSVVEVVERWHGRTGSDDDQRNREYKRIFLVRTNDFQDGPFTVGSATGIPRLYAPYSTNQVGEADLGAVCSKIEPVQGEDPCVWEVTCTYSPIPAIPKEQPSSDKSTEQTQPENPLSRPPVYRFGTSKGQKVLYKDVVTDQGVMMSSTERPDPPIMVDTTFINITIVRNEASFSWGINALADFVNSDVFLGFPPLSVKFEGASAESRYENDLFYYEVTYAFTCKNGGGSPAGIHAYKQVLAETKNREAAFAAALSADPNQDEGHNRYWTPVYFIDRGFLEFVDGQLVKILDNATKHPINSPMLLDGQGHALRFPGASPRYRRYNAYRLTSFNLLMGF